MEQVMTDFQFKSLLKMVLAVVETCKDVEEAKAKIQQLYNGEEE